MKHEYEDSSEDEQLEAKPVITARSIFSDNLGLVQAVIKCYRDVSDRPPLSAMNLDPESHQSHWTYIGADYQADVESKLRRFLMDKPDRADRVELRQAWNELLKDKPTIGDKERRLVQGLGPILRRAGLLPAVYFKPTIKRKAI